MRSLPCCAAVRATPAVPKPLPQASPMARLAAPKLTMIDLAAHGCGRELVEANGAHVFGVDSLPLHLRSLADAIARASRRAHGSGLARAAYAAQVLHAAIEEHGPIRHEPPVEQRAEGGEEGSKDVRPNVREQRAKLLEHGRHRLLGVLRGKEAHRACEQRGDARRRGRACERLRQPGPARPRALDKRDELGATEQRALHEQARGERAAHRR
mmetsp:Transcript_1512/g.4970  ORF Transcript_1512/g.4970 Transcript_1512/m.4970 type:complete len:212 (-) Transcript_1512:105-740(-)